MPLPPAIRPIRDRLAPSRARLHGYSLIEVLTPLIVAGVLGTAALAGYDAMVDKTRVDQAVVDMQEIVQQVQGFEQARGRLPDSLDELTGIARVDPWGKPYQYRNLKVPTAAGPLARKRQNLMPLNGDFDLYSAGADRNSATSLNARASRDDVVRALDGRYIGLVAELEP